MTKANRVPDVSHVVIPAVVSGRETDWDWSLEGACRFSELGPDAWFPRVRTERTVKAAKATCRRCRVNARCLSESLRLDGTEGIWGGLDDRERQALRKTMTC
jgi:WhiB family redox-sensing transcriptional regulator